jgi:hypothetical protein
MHRHNILLVGAALALFVLVLSETPRPRSPPPTPLEAPVPLLETTPTTDAGAIAARFIPGKLPPPASNQVKEVDKCPWPAKFLEGGCWMAVANEKPPCKAPDGRKAAWAHEDQCWVPYAEAKPPRQSGEPRPRGVADP